MKIILFLFCCLAFMFPLPGKATCFEMERQTHAGFEAFVQCRNTFGEPRYEITHHYFWENFAGLFSFDLRSAGLVCNEYEFNGQTTGECRTASIRGVSSQYKSRHGIVNMIDLDGMKVKEIDQAYEKADLFKYPDSSEEVMIENCFVLVGNKRQFTMGYKKNSQFMNLSNCLSHFERFMKKNFKLFLN